MNRKEFERESYVEWEPLFDVGCVTGRPVTPRDDCGDLDSDTQRENTTASPAERNQPMAGSGEN